MSRCYIEYRGVWERRKRRRLWRRNMDWDVLRWIRPTSVCSLLNSFLVRRPRSSLQSLCCTRPEMLTAAILAPNRKSSFEKVGSQFFFIALKWMLICSTFSGFWAHLTNSLFSEVWKFLVVWPPSSCGGDIKIVLPLCKVGNLRSNLFFATEQNSCVLGYSGGLTKSLILGTICIKTSVVTNIRIIRIFE